MRWLVPLMLVVPVPLVRSGIRAGGPALQAQPGSTWKPAWVKAARGRAASAAPLTRPAQNWNLSMQTSDWKKEEGQP